MTNQFLDFLIAKKLGKQPLTPHNLSFSLIPYLNAVQRGNDQDAKRNLFIAFTGDKSSQEAAYKQMNAAYRIQKETMTRMVDELSKQADGQVERGDKVLFVRMAEQDKEYGGLAANKLKSKYGLPVVCLREADARNWSGSVRSDCDSLDMMNATGMAKCQGHQSAHGILIRKTAFEDFRAWANQQDWNGGVKTVAADIEPDDITRELCETIEQAAWLWANDLPTPTFHCKFEIPVGVNVLCGKTGNCFRYTPFIKFGCNEREIERLNPNAKRIIEAVVELGVNEWAGVRYPQARIVDWEIDVEQPQEEIFDFDSIFST